MKFLDKYKPEAEKASVRKKILLRNRFLWKLRRLNVAELLGRREKIGGLVIRKGAAELAVWGRAPKEEGGEEIVLLHYGTKTFSPDVLEDGKIIRPEELRRALAELKEEAAKFSLESVVVSLPSGVAEFMTFNFPANLNKEEIDNAIALAAESSFPLPAAEVYFDRVISDGHDGRHKEAVVGMGRRKDIESYLNVVSRSGFSPVAVETHSMSLGRMFSAQTQGRLAIFLETDGVLAVLYDESLPHLQFAIPKFALDESAKTTIEQKIADFIKSFVHSASSGDKRIAVRDIVFVPDEKEHWGIGVYLRKNKIPEITETENAFKFPGAAGLRDSWTAVTLGAASRGLIPRRSDALISLMSVGTETAYERARFVSFADFMQKLNIIFGGFFVAVLGAALIFINILGRDIEERLRSWPEPPAEAVKIKNAAASFNKYTGAIAAVEDRNPRWEELFSEIDKLKNAGIIFNRLQVPYRGGAIILEGKASNRDALLLLKKVLDGSSVFSYEPLPLPLLLEKENIVFSLKLGLKEPQKFFP